MRYEWRAWEQEAQARIMIHGQQPEFFPLLQKTQQVFRIKNSMFVSSVQVRFQYLDQQKEGFMHSRHEEGEMPCLIWPQA